MIRIGIVREGKTPQDNRTPFSPKQCKEIQEQNAEVQFIIQPSPICCFSDEEYKAQGLIVQEDLSNCEIIFGVKEALIDSLIENKTYLFFSHTKKAQPHNKKLMQALLAKKIRMIDYECLTHDDGHRVVGFGYWAGVGCSVERAHVFEPYLLSRGGFAGGGAGFDVFKSLGVGDEPNTRGFVAGAMARLDAARVAVCGLYGRCDRRCHIL